MSDREGLGSVNLPDNSELGFFKAVNPIPAEKEAPTYGETAAASFRLFNDVYRAGKYVNERARSRFDNDVPDDFNAKDEGYLDKVPEDYWGQILSCETRNEADTMVTNINQEFADKDTRERSGWFANLSTTLGASIISPTTLFPIGQTVKYASMSKGAFATAIQGAKSIVPAVALQNAILTSTKQTEGFKEWVQDTVVDSFLGTSIAGAVGAFAAKGLSSELKGAKAFFKAVEDDVEIKYRLNEDGTVAGMQAVGRNDSVGAARVQTVQQLLDSGEVSFKDNKFIKNYFGFAQPIIEGVTNRFAIVRSYTDGLFSNPFLTAGGNIHAISDPGAENFLRVWRGTYGNLQTFTKQKWLDYLDIKGPARGVRGAVGEFTGKSMPEKQFSEMVSMAIRRGGEHEIPEVKEAANSWIKELYDPLIEQLKKRRPDFEEHEYTNISRYLNRVYDKAKIQEKPEQFLTDMITYIDDTNKKIMSLSKPINDIKEKSTALKKQIKEFKSAQRIATPERKLEFTEKIKNAEIELKRQIDEVAELNKKIQEGIKSGDIGLDLLRSKPDFTPQQIKSIEELNRPVDAAKERLEVAKKSGKKEEIKKAKEELKNVQKELKEKLESPDLDSAIYRTDMQGNKKLRKADMTPQLRRALGAHEIRNVAEGIRDTILQENEEQLVGRIFDAIQSGGSNPLKERTLLWNDSRAEPWLLNDVNVLGGLYMDQMSKRIYADDVFARYGINPREGQKGVVRLLKQEYGQERDKLLAQPESAAREKGLKQLQREFDKSQKFLEDSYKIYMGNYSDRSTMASRVTQGLKQFAAATLLGNVPILQLSEFFSPLFKFTFSEYIFDGLAPALNRMKYVAKERIKQWGGQNTDYIRGAFADAGLGNNVAHGARMDALFGYGAQYQPKTVLERYVTNLANVSQNISLSNHISDFQETMVSFSSQSSLIRTMKRYLDGVPLTKYEIDKMDLARINPEKYAKRIVQQFESHGKDVEGAFLANFHLWKDLDASLAFRSAIEKETRAVITKPNMLDTPFAFRNPIISTMTQFLSWSLAATTNFTVPTITNPDKQKLLGLLLMMGSAAFIDPLRQLAKGEEVDTSLESLAASSFTNSGIFGWHFQEIQKINSAIDFPFLRPFQADRFRRKDFASLFGGPTAGIVNDMASVISAMVNGEINERDARKALTMALPFTGTWYLRKPVHDMLEAQELPKNRYEAKRQKEAE